MELVTGIADLRRALSRREHRPRYETVAGVRTGLTTWDALAPGGTFRRGSVHELLSPRRSPVPTSLAVRLACVAQGDGGGERLVWSDPAGELYPPALVAAGVDLSRLIVLRPRTAVDELWALAECMRCRGVGATVASLSRLSQLTARRLQLAAEAGGGIGVFLRPHASGSGGDHYAAATRWLVRTAPGDRDVQRWSVELVHGHGGRAGEAVLLEVDRDANALRVFETLADRPALPAAARAAG